MINEAARKASTEAARVLIEAYRTERGVHAETLIGAAAALTGEFALRAMEPVLPDEGWVMSETVNLLLFENEERGEIALWTVIRTGAVRAGASLDDLPNPVDVVFRVAEKVGSSPFPPLTIPERHYPHEWSPNACPRLRGMIEEITNKHDLSKTERAMAMAFAIIILIEETKEVLPPAIAATLALEIMIGVSRMAPMREPVKV